MVVAVDRDPAVDVGRLRELGVEVRLEPEEETLQLLIQGGIDLVVTSPGVPATSPILLGASERAIPVWDELELGARLLPNPIARDHRDERQDHDDARFSGEMFRAASTAGGGGREHRTPDHVRRRDRRPGHLARLRGRCRSSSTTWRRSARDRRAPQPRARPSRPLRNVRVVRGREAPHLRAADRGRHRDRPSRLRAGPRRRPQDRVLRRRPASRRARASSGEHNRENAAAATAAARAAGIPDEAIALALVGFPGVPHRIELVRELHGVRYVNDSKATNVAAALRADRGVPGLAAAPHSRRPRQERELRAARGCARARDRAISDRRRRRRDRRRARRGRRLVRPAAACSRTRIAARFGQRGSRRCRAPLAGLRELRPVSRLRGRAATSFVAWWRSCREGGQPLRPEAPRARDARARGVRAGDGVQRDLRVGRGRERRPDELPQATGDLRLSRHRADGARVAFRLPPACGSSRRRSCSWHSGCARPCSSSRRRSTARGAGSSSARRASSPRSSRSSRSASSQRSISRGALRRGRSAS